MTSTQTSERVPQVVFACVRNGGRSVASRVLAELARRLGTSGHDEKAQRSGKQAPPEA